MAAKKPAKKHAPAAEKEPWERENPRTASGQESKHLSAAQKASAKSHAKAAGRPYPNLIDNMQAAKGGAAKARK
jgi:hypothetical protein